MLLEIFSSNVHVINMFSTLLGFVSCAVLSCPHLFVVAVVFLTTTFFKKSTPQSSYTKLAQVYIWMLPTLISVFKFILSLVTHFVFILIPPLTLKNKLYLESQDPLKIPNMK